MADRHDAAPGSMARRARGSASVEYALASAVVFAALFVPIPELGASAFELVLDALRRFQANTSHLLSLP